MGSEIEIFLYRDKIWHQATKVSQNKKSHPANAKVEYQVQEGKQDNKKR